MNQEFDLAVSEIRNEPISDSVVEAAAARVWSRLASGIGLPASPGDEIASLAPTLPARPEAPAHAVAASPHISNCESFRALIPDLRANRLNPARATLLRDHLHECVACRRVYEGRVAVMPQAAPVQKPRQVYKFAAAAAIVAAAGISIWVGFDQFGHSGRAIVQSVNGSLFEISADGIHPLAAGAALPDGVEIRTAKDSTAMLELRDGSLVELRERSAFTASQGPRDITVRLSRGSVIVQAAHRSSGHLFVDTADCRVAVTGTIFGVSAGAKGSRVSVVQGEVHVDQDNQEKVLHPGNQVVTSPDLEPESVRDDLAWSRNRTRYESILGSLGQALSHIPQPELRYESQLLGRMPANVIFFAGIPNLAQYLGEAEDVFGKKMAQSPDLQRWWESHGGRTAAVIEKLRAASEYLGGEIAVAAVPGGDGPAFLSEIKRPGFAAFLEKSGVPAAEHERNGFVLFGAPRAVEQLSGVLDSPNGSIQSTDFYRRVEDVYHQGAGFLICANVAQASWPAHPDVAQTSRSAHPEASGALPTNAQTLIFNETQNNGVTGARVSLDFNGPRTGIAAWLASPAPMGSLDYVSPDAAAAVAAVVPTSGAIVDQLKVIAPKELGAVREALAGSLGGEFALAVDGPLMPVPSWKLIAEVYDPAAAQAALQQAVAGYTGDPSNAGHKPLVTSQETFEGRAYYTIAVPDAGPLLEFHYTFAGGYLIAGPTRAVVARALQIKESTNSLMHSSRVMALMPRDRFANFSLVFYQNVAPAIAPIAGLLGGIMPHRPGESSPSLGGLASVKPSLIAAYAEPERITFAANGDLLGPALASLMRGDLAGAAGSTIPFFQPHGTRKREMAYR